MFKHLITIVFIITVFLFFASCTTTHQSVSYFHDLPDTLRPTALKTIHFANPVIRPDDVLTITLQTLDNSVTSALNTGNNAGNNNSPIPDGYLVNGEGNVELPFIGKIKLSGLTTSGAQEAIRKEADKIFNNPIINVRYANFKITVLGEVNHPSTYTMGSEKITLFDAIGLAGDLTIYGRRENVLLVRDSANDNRQVVRLDLNSKNIVSSPYFYLQPNDMIYVEPNKNKVVASDAQRGRTLAIIGIALSALAIILTRINF